MAEPVFDPEKLTKLPAPAFDPSKLAAKQLDPPAEPDTGSYWDRASDIIPDITQQAYEGVKTTMGAPGKIMGTSENPHEELIPGMEKPPTSATSSLFSGVGASPDTAKSLARKMQIGEGILDLVMGPLQTAGSVIMGPYRSMVSRPLEENVGIPKEASELALGIAAGRPRTGRAPKKLTSEMLRAEADKNYNAARALPIQFWPDVGPQIANNIETALMSSKHGYRPKNSELTWDTLDYLRKDMPNHFPSIEDLEVARTQLRETARQVDANGHRTRDAGAASWAAEYLDKEMKKLTDKDTLVGGHLLPKLHENLELGRRNYAASIRADFVEKALKDAVSGANVTGKGANVENKIRQEFRKIVNNPKKAQRYTPDELAMFDEVANGTKVRNLARLAGSTAPTGPVSMATSLGIGALVGGKEGMRAVPVIGQAFKYLSDRRTRKVAEDAADLVRSRSPLYQSMPQNPRLPMWSPYPSLSPLQGLRTEEEEP